MPYPESIKEFVENIALIDDRAERVQVLIDMGKSFQPPAIEKPYPAENRVPGCESEVYTWVNLNQNSNLNIQIVVDNPQGLSAMAMAQLLLEGLQNQPPAIANLIDEDLVAKTFGPELSMGKSLGLTNLVRQIKAQALKLA